MNLARVDVTIPTWNSAATLARTLESIRADSTFPLGKVIVVDRASTDATVAIAAASGCEVLQDTVSLGSAREKAFQRASTEWIALIDSDIVIPDGWFAQMWACATDEVGGVQGMALTPFQMTPRARADMRARYFPEGPSVLRRGERAYTNTTLVRHRLVRELRLSRFEAYEDRAIGEAVLAQGFQWLKVPVFVEHAFGLWEAFPKCRWNAAGKRLAGYFRFDEELRQSVYAVQGGLKDSVRLRDSRFFVHAVLATAGAWAGILGYRKYAAKFPPAKGRPSAPRPERD